jgi:predicted RNase H-like HicB family nuclease
MRTFIAYVEFDAETGLYVGMVPDIPGAHTTGETMEELRENLKEVLALCREEGVIPENRPEFIGLTQIELAG